MTAHRNFKRRVRARAAKTGESYTAALRHFRPTPSGDPDMPEDPNHTLRIAVAQSTVHQDPTDPTLLRDSGAEVRDLMRQAADAGARLVHFTEGAICFPSKRVMSELGPDEIGPSDWSKADWALLHDELDRIAALSRDLGIWTVIPSVHQLPDGTRPHNSMYVVSDQGKVVARYDERMLSTTKITWMYTPGTEPVTFEVDGYRFGLALGLDVLFPELFTEYDRLEVDGVLVSYSTTGSSGNEVAPTHARGHASMNTYWVSFAVPANPTAGAESWLIDPRANVVAEGPADGTPGIAVTDLIRDDVTGIGREFRRRTRERVGS
ncbi:carbon-nitrogen hydrolase family protein [Kribbella sp. CA-247076]|uniref:carbon-nitrogen hydrolase family protein n=1 Tax=Kribbella sp. CA-247076 TaxID=3239941 RepID=UPI003D93E2D5